MVQSGLDICTGWQVWFMTTWCNDLFFFCRMVIWIKCSKQKKGLSVRTQWVRTICHVLQVVSSLWPCSGSACNVVNLSWTRIDNNKLASKCQKRPPFLPGCVPHRDNTWNLSWLVPLNHCYSLLWLWHFSSQIKHEKGTEQVAVKAVAHSAIERTGKWRNADCPLLHS